MSQTSITDHFAKRCSGNEKGVGSKKQRLEEMNSSDQQSSLDQPSCSQPQRPELMQSAEEISSPFSDQINSGEGSLEFDIGQFVCSLKHSDLLISNLLENPWKPDFTYKFPMCGSRNLKFQIKWMGEFTWLLYSEKLKGAFCKCCVLFAAQSTAGKGGHQQLGKLVTQAYTNWKNAKEDFRNHQVTDYHQSSTIKAADFLKVYKKQSVAIDEQLNCEAVKERQRKCKRLVPIVETIIFCGKQNIPLRGETDWGPLSLLEPPENDGNFRALLRMRANSGDEVLKDHLSNCSKNATYFSPRIQNELIEIIGRIIQEEIVHKVNKAECFSVLADETADISGKEQMSICLRYFDGIQMREDFVGFVELENQTAQHISQAILCYLKNLGVDTSFLRGQGYDGASAMKGSINGVQKLVTNIIPQALYVHCSSHALNLALSDSCDIKEVSNALSSMNEIIKFFTKSPKRQTILVQHIRSSCNPDHNTHRREKLISFCETRFVQRHDSILRFMDLYEFVLQCLEHLEDNSDRETSCKAQQLVKVATSSSFILTIHVVESILSTTVNLSRDLQTVNCDLLSSMAHVNRVIKYLQQRREQSGEKFSEIFKNAQEFANKFDVQLSIPRRTGRQTQRNNVPAQSVESYYRISLYNTFLDHVINSLQARFVDHQTTISKLQRLVPLYIEKRPVEDFSEVLVFYKNDIGDMRTVKSEIEIWHEMWSKPIKSERPANAINALSECDETLFPHVHKLLKILATLPVTTMTNERSFSTLRRLKTYLRNSIGQNRLVGLALMTIYREFFLDVPNIVETFMQTGNRRL